MDLQKLIKEYNLKEHEIKMFRTFTKKEKESYINLQKIDKEKNEENTITGYLSAIYHVKTEIEEHIKNAKIPNKVEPEYNQIINSYRNLNNNLEKVFNKYQLNEKQKNQLEKILDSSKNTIDKYNIEKRNKQELIKNMSESSKKAIKNINKIWEKAMNDKPTTSKYLLLKLASRYKWIATGALIGFIGYGGYKNISDTLKAFDQMMSLPYIPLNPLQHIIKESTHSMISATQHYFSNVVQKGLLNPYLNLTILASVTKYSVAEYESRRDHLKSLYHKASKIKTKLYDEFEKHHKKFNQYENYPNNHYELQIYKRIPKEKVKTEMNRINHYEKTLKQITNNF